MNEIDWASERARMVENQIRRRGITDPLVLEAVSRVPRERFVPAALRARSYADHALHVAHGQTISQPFVVAAMTQAAQIEPEDRVLEIGTGSGYQAAILAQLAAEVFTVERIPDLAEAARATLDELGITNVSFRTGDGSLGWPEAAPFQAILVTAGAPEPPPSLLRQLDPEGGRLIAPIGEHARQELVCIEREGTSWVSEQLMACRFVPLLGAEGWSGESG